MANERLTLEEMMTANGIVLANRIAVRKLTAIGETVENVDVVCHDLPGRFTNRRTIRFEFSEAF